MGKRTKLAFQLLLLITLILTGSWIQLPYFYQSPGSAIELSPIVHVEGVSEDEKGAFMMTTVSVNRTNVWEYLYATVNPSMDLLEVTQVKAHNETDEQYFNRQKGNMMRSQQKAIKVAFEQADVPIDVKSEGAIINFFIPGMSAERVLEVGDVVIEVDNTPIHSADELIQSFKGKAEGEISRLKVVRGEETLYAEVEMVLFPEQYQVEDGKRTGIGILSPETKLTITPSRKVDFKTENIGGPSAGLMFTLELINQLSEEDITKGKRIAGTGTMELNGNVGPIGGAKHKVVAADREGAVIFFAPDNGSETSNYQEALQAANSKKLDITVVPVKTIQDAMDYLKKIQ